MNTPPPSARLPLVDALRGFAVAQMIVYHFIYDLNYFGHLALAMTREQPWVGWRTAIVTQFLLLVGLSLVLRLANRPGGRDFWMRWAQVAAAAALVSAGSWLMFGSRFIYIGILHFIAIALVAARLLAPLREINFALAIAAFAAWLLLRDPAFNDFPAHVLGLVTVKPRTEDYVPLLPWIAVVCVGLGLGALWQRRGFALSPFWQGINENPPRLLVFAGTWALTVYLLHQPLMIGLLWLVRSWA